MRRLRLEGPLSPTRGPRWVCEPRHRLADDLFEVSAGRLDGLAGSRRPKKPAPDKGLGEALHLGST
jgi:hypothetical protein